MNHPASLSLAESNSSSQLKMTNGRPVYSMYRLQYDLAQLADDLPRGIRVVTDDTNMRRFCLILEPQEGHLKGCRIHLSIMVPLNWPCVPLSASIDTPFQHPNVFGGYICCDILNNSGSYYSNYNGGYSPAYSLAGTFMQLASFFSGSSIEQSGGYKHDVSEYSALAARESLLQAEKHFDCKFCDWKSLSSNSCVLAPSNDEELCSVKNALLKPANDGVLHALNDDVLLVVISFLDTSSLFTFSSVYDRVAKLMKETNEIARREVRCFVTKRDPREAILGVGLQYDMNYKAFASTFDYISKFAFDALNIRKDSTNREIQFWLPLAIDGNHYAKASDDIKERLCFLDVEARNRTSTASRPQPQAGPQQNNVKHLFAMANALVVDFMKTCDAAEISPSLLASSSRKPESSLLKASERAIAGYCSIMHLIVSYAIENRQIIVDANRTVSKFNTSLAGRHKSAVPDLGQFLVQVCLVNEFSWSDVRASVVQEMFTRSVLWQLERAPKGAGLPGLAFLEEDAICEWRLTQTFKASRTGLRLLLFQIFFMEKLAKREGSSLLNLRNEFNSRRGLAPPGLTTELLERIQFIYKMDSLGVFAKESGRVANREGMTKFLRERVVESAKVGYHRSTTDWPRERLLAYRARDDQDFRRKLVEGGNNDAVASADDQPTFFIQDNRRNDSSAQGARGRGADRGARGGGGRGNRRGNGRRGW